MRAFLAIAVLFVSSALALAQQTKEPPLANPPAVVPHTHPSTLQLCGQNGPCTHYLTPVRTVLHAAKCECQRVACCVKHRRQCR